MNRSSNSRYGSLLSEEQHALLGELYINTEDTATEAPVLRSYIVNPCASIPLSGYDHEFEDSDYDEPLASKGELFNDSALHDNFGAWPQRLLHVDSMTSYQWKPGNVYGDYLAPKYNAISYTWGRYEIDNPYVEKKVNKRVMKHTQAIKIRGVDWNIPRIDPDHFKEEEFQTAIKHACLLGGSDKIEFLWIDVGCIDQNNGPQKDLEIGRQAIIFRGAERVFIWLTRLNEAHLSSILTDLFESSIHAVEQVHGNHLQIQPTNEQASWILRSRTALDNLFIDPWFSSLWTLQEAFLCPHAYLLGREANHIPFLPTQTPEKHDPVDLSALFKVCDRLRRLSESKFMTGPTYWQTPAPPGMLLRRKYLREINTMVIQRGLSALATSNPMALYGIASYRRTRSDTDRVYGIEQVFGFKLGTSAYSPGTARRFYNRFVLEVQLSSKILEMFPVLSQIHVFTEPVELGRGWRASSASRIPDLDLNSNIASTKYHAACTLEIKLTQGMGMGSFTGRTCAFENLRLAWSRVSDPPPWDQPNPEDTSPQQICLDVFLKHKKPEFRQVPSEKLGPEGFEAPYPAVWGFSRDVPRGKEQHEMAWWMVQRLEELFPSRSLVVLLLGHFEDRSKGESSGKLFNTGLVLLYSEIQGLCYWRRLGFCIWEYRKDAPGGDSGLLSARENDPNWQMVNGLFG